MSIKYKCFSKNLQLKNVLSIKLNRSKKQVKKYIKTPRLREKLKFNTKRVIL